MRIIGAFSSSRMHCNEVELTNQKKNTNIYNNKEGF